jgi:hypothetical protein
LVRVGDYGLTQFAYAIVDKPENLPKIKEVFDTKEFRDLMELCAVGQLTINYKVISRFKKDFWKIFTLKFNPEFQLWLLHSLNYTKLNVLLLSQVILIKSMIMRKLRN